MTSLGHASTGRTLRRVVSSSLVLPLLLLQTFQVASLFCEGLSHSSVLSVNCPHHVQRSGHGAELAAASGAEREGHATGASGPHTRGEDRPCTCPGTGNPLPDGLILSALGGLGLPGCGHARLPTRLASLRIDTDLVSPVPRISSHLLERPPRLHG